MPVPSWVTITIQPLVSVGSLYIIYDYKEPWLTLRQCKHSGDNDLAILLLWIP